jgi:hypothetical protein
MTITRLPLANLEKHGASLISDDTGFTVKCASGAKLPLFSLPPDPFLLEVESETLAPLSTWAVQKILETTAEFDSGKTKLDKDDSISDIEKTRRLTKLVQKANDAREHIEGDFAKEEAAAQAFEAAHYSVPPLKADDVVGALRDHEIRNGLRAMPEQELNLFKKGLNSGEDRLILEAVLRSPLKMGRLDEFAQNGWRALRDREDPQKRAGIDLRKSYNTWGRRIVSQAQGALSVKLRGALPTK